jgi:ATP-binding cassette subfamily B protein
MLDRILVFEQGAVVEEGTHEELVRRQEGVYKRLFERQALGLLPDGDGDEDDEGITDRETELSA